MVDDRKAADVKKADLKDLRLGDAAFRRRLINAGLRTLDDLLAISTEEIDSTFDPNTADTILDLQEEYEKNPERFERNYSRQSHGKASAIPVAKHEDSSNSKTKRNRQI